MSETLLTRPQQKAPPEEHLERALSNRHIQLIAIGGAIGTGLFMGSGKVISLAGPSIIFVYMAIGFMLFFVMRAMGELLLSNLEYKSFADFAADLLGPWAGFFTGWTYWFCWIVTGMADIVAIAGYVRFWWADFPLWIPAVATIVLLCALNLPTVKAFGETEFWFALVKVVTIVTLIVVGLVMVMGAFESPNGSHAAFSNLWNDGGFFPTGPMGFVAGFQIAVFAFVGIELVGTTAAETKDPTKTLPRAINSIPVRVMLFYVVALVIIMSVTPWREIVPEKSPFVAMFSLAGLGTAAAVINFVVLTSAASSANSGIYSTSRMIYGLAVEGDAPSRFRHLTKHHVPARALVFSCSALIPSVALLYAGGSIIEAFTMVTTVSALLFMFVWGIILVSYLVYRRDRPQLHAESTFKMPGGVVMCWVVLGFFGFIVWALAQFDDTRAALLVTPLWFVLLGIAWFGFMRHRPHNVVRRDEFRARPTSGREPVGTVAD
jgi:D-serine/D-alanine/glycine transporter